MFRRLRKMPLYLSIIISMILGIIFGIFASNNGYNLFVIDWISPLGKIFINLLKLIAVPLIITSLIAGISEIQDISKLSRMGFKMLSLYILTTIIAISIGLVSVNTLSPGNAFPIEKRMELQEKYSSKIISNIEQSNSSPLQFLVDIVPENIFGAFSNNSNMLQVIFFSLLFGIALIALPNEKTHIVKDFFKSMNEIILKIIDFIMQFAPVGVFALMAAIISDFSSENNSGAIDLLAALGFYSLTVIIGLIVLVLIIYPIIIKFIAKKNPLEFFRAILQAQLLAFSTSSSAATLPVTMERCENKLNIRKDVSSFCLPIGATINMDGTSLYQAVAAVFIAQVFGIDLTFVQQLTIILTATLASIGSAAVPGTGIIMLVIVLNSINVPSEGITIILAVDRILDMFRTVVNVTSDSMVALIINKSVKSE